MFQHKVFRKQMYSIEGSTCDIVGTSRRPGSGVSRYGRHGTCHARHVEGGRKNCLAKIHLYLQFLESLFCTLFIYKLQSSINTAPLPKA